MKKRKVFIIGYPKTATTSLNRALEIMGYKGRKGPPELIQSIDDKNWLEVDRVVKEYDTLNDIPWPKLYKKLYKDYPDGKFILTTRDENLWIKSLEKHFGFRHFDFHEWFYGHGTVMGSQDAYIKSFRKHNEEVSEFFSDKKQSFLKWDLTENPTWDVLVNFLEESKPDSPFPFENRSPNINRFRFIRLIKDIFITLEKKKRKN